MDPVMNDHLKIVKITPLIGVLLSASCVYANDAQQPALSIGANYTIDYQPYKGKRTYQSVLPTGFYDNGRFYLEGDEAGIYLLNDEHNELRLNAAYDGNSYDPSGVLAGLERRKWSVMAGGSYMRITPFGGFKAQIGTDVLSRSKGTVATASYVAEITKGKWSFYPEIGLQWNDAKYNQYYFGVTPEETQRTGIATYQPSSSIHPYMSLATDYEFSKHWSAFGTLNVDFLSKQQSNSPMIDRHTDFYPSIGIKYKF